MAKIQSQEQTKRPGTGDIVAGGLINAFQGMTAEYGDEILGGVGAVYDAATSDTSLADAYAKNVKKVRELRDQYNQAAGGWADVGKLGGSMLTVGGGAKLLAPIMGPAAGTITAGAGYGGAESYGASEEFDPKQISQDTLIAGGMTAGLEGAGRAIASGFNKLWPQGADYIQDLGQDFLKRLGLTDESIMERARDMGPEASMADVSGITGPAYVQGALPHGSFKALQNIEENYAKTAGAKSRIKQKAVEATGKAPYRYHQNYDDFRADTRARASENYGNAMREQVSMTPKMQRMMDFPEVREAFDTVRARWDAEGKDMAFVTPEMMQEVKWEMDRGYKALADSLDGQSKKDSARYGYRRDAFRNSLHEMYPGLKKADKQYATDMRIKDSMEDGKKYGLQGADQETIVNRIKGMTQAEKQAYLAGAMSKVYGRLEGTAEDALGAVNYLDSQGAVRMLTQLTGSKEKADALLKQIRAEKRYREVKNLLTGGSQTELRKQAGERMKEYTRNENPIVKAVADEGVIGSIVNRATEIITKTPAKMTPSQVDEFVDLMTKAGGPEQFLMRMQQNNATPTQLRKAAEVIARVVSQGAKYAAPGALAISGDE
jgi:hypothetical protein